MQLPAQSGGIHGWVVPQAKGTECYRQFFRNKPVPRRLSLYSAAFAVGHLESDGSSEDEEDAEAMLIIPTKAPEAPEAPAAPAAPAVPVAKPGKRRVALTQVSSAVPAIPTGNLVDQLDLADLRMVVPTLSAQQARAQLQTAYEQSKYSQFRPFRTFTRPRRLMKGSEAREASTAAVADVAALVRGESFSFRRHARFTLDHLIAQLQLHTESDAARARAQAQAFMWRLQTSNDRLIYGASVVDSANDDGVLSADDVLLPYGESSDEDAAYSDSLQREIAAEQRDAAKRSARVDSMERERVARVRRTAQQRMDHFAAEWQAARRPRLEMTAAQLWRRHAGYDERLAARLLRQQWLLPRMVQAIVDSGASQRAQIARQCESLRATTDQIAETQWLLDLIAGPLPPPRAGLARNQKQNNRKTKKKKAQKKQSLPRRLVSPPSFPRDSAAPRGDAAVSSDDDDDSDSDDSMADFIDDVDSGPLSKTDGRVVPQDAVPPARKAMLSQLHRQAAHAKPGPALAAADLMAVLTRYSADAMYGMATRHVQSMARGVALATNYAKEPPPHVVLRVWAEFQMWLHATRPAVRVSYDSAELCRHARSQMKHVLEEQSLGGDVETLPVLTPRWARKQYARVTHAAAACRMQPMHWQESGTEQFRDAGAPNVLDIDGHSAPEVLHVLHDNGVAMRTAFRDFYRWRRRSDQNGTSKSSPVVAQQSSDDLDGASVLDSSDNNVSVDSKRIKHTRPAAAPPPNASKRRRNIRAIREESADVLEMRRQQLQAEREIQRRAHKQSNAMTEEQKRPQSQKHVRAIEIIDIDAEDDDTATVMAAGTLSETPPVPAVTSIDVSRIGVPVLINPGHPDHQRDVHIPGFIAAHLKPHQIEGVQFMWRNVVMLSDHSSATKSRGGTRHGCVLAHAMGLGKTLQTIALVYTLLSQVTAADPSPDFSDSVFASRRVLILCPPTVQSNWADEFCKWTGVTQSRNISAAIDVPLLPPPYSLPAGHATSLPHAVRENMLLVVRAVRMQARGVLSQVISYDNKQPRPARLAQLQAWNRRGGVMVMGYQGFRSLMAAIETAPADSAEAAELRRILVAQGPSLVIADEGHVIKNKDTKLAVFVNKLGTRARVCLTGYPLQNRLEEYWTMVDFCFRGFLGSLADFRNAYVNPITNGLYRDASPAEKRTSTLRMKALHRILEGVVDRRDASVLFRNLPRKVEYIISCPLTPAQLRLYYAFLAHFLGVVVPPAGSGQDAAGGAVRAAGVVTHGNMLMTICNHPAICRETVNSAVQRRGNNRLADPASPVIALDDELLLDNDVIESRDFKRLFARDTSWCRDFFAEFDQTVGDSLRLPEHSVKVQLMLDIIRHSVALDERVLVFSRSIPTLDYLLRAVADSGAAPHASLLRLDGSTPVHVRQGMIDQFNSAESVHRVFFISAGTGSIGVNLVAASRVIIFDIGWNPLYDEQAIARAYRYGQRRRVYVYRLMTAGTWEERLFSNNVFKVGMTRRVVDRQNMGRRSTREEMQQYFQPPPQATPAMPEAAVAQLAEEHQDDVVFTRLLADHADQLAKVTTQATLVAEEEDLLQEGDQELIQNMVASEMQRLGHNVPIATEAHAAMESQESASLSASVAAAVPSFNIRRLRVRVVSGLLLVLQIQLSKLPPFPASEKAANEWLSALKFQVDQWYLTIDAFIKANDAQNPEQRGQKMMATALPGVCTDAFCNIVKSLYGLTGLELQQTIQKLALTSQ